MTMVRVLQRLRLGMLHVISKLAGTATNTCVWKHVHTIPLILLWVMRMFILYIAVRSFANGALTEESGKETDIKGVRTKRNAFHAVQESSPTLRSIWRTFNGVPFFVQCLSQKRSYNRHLF